MALVIPTWGAELPSDCACPLSPGGLGTEEGRGGWGRGDLGSAPPPGGGAAPRVPTVSWALREAGRGLNGKGFCYSRSPSRCEVGATNWLQ